MPPRATGTDCQPATRYWIEEIARWYGQTTRVYVKEVAPGLGVKAVGRSSEPAVASRGDCSQEAWERPHGEQAKKRFRLVSPRSQSSAWKAKNGGICGRNRFSEVIRESKEFPVLNQGRNSGLRQVSIQTTLPICGWQQSHSTVPDIGTVRSLLAGGSRSCRSHAYKHPSLPRKSPHPQPSTMTVALQSASSWPSFAASPPSLPHHPKYYFQDSLTTFLVSTLA